VTSWRFERSAARGVCGQGAWCDLSRQRSTSSASTLLACIAACTASASATVNLMPVSTPAGPPSWAATSTIVVAEPSGATSIQYLLERFRQQ
jgi:hypothetical protein